MRPTDQGNGRKRKGTAEISVRIPLAEGSAQGFQRHNAPHEVGLLTNPLLAVNPLEVVRTVLSAQPNS